MHCGRSGLYPPSSTQKTGLPNSFIIAPILLLIRALALGSGFAVGLLAQLSQAIRGEEA